MITKKNIAKLMMVEVLNYIDEKINKNRDVQRAVFIAAYEEQPIQPVPEKVTGGAALIVSTAMLAGVLNLAPSYLRGWAIPFATGCAGGFAISGALMAKAFNNHIHRLAHQPVNKRDVIHGDHVDNLAEAFVLGEYCHRSRNPDHVKRALSGVEGARLLGPVELASIIDKAAHPAEPRRLARRQRSLLNLDSWH